MRRRTVVTLETNRVLVFRRRGGPILAWCEACARQVQMLTPDEAAVLSHSSPRAIYRQMEAGKVHFTETADGRTYICLSSLRGRGEQPDWK
jgi:hypothetical protein